MTGAPVTAVIVAGLVLLLAAPPGAAFPLAAVLCAALAVAVRRRGRR